MISVTGYATVISGKTVDGDHGMTNFTATVCNDLHSCFLWKACFQKLRPDLWSLPVGGHLWVDFGALRLAEWGQVCNCIN